MIELDRHAQGVRQIYQNTLRQICSHEPGVGLECAYRAIRRITKVDDMKNVNPELVLTTKKLKAAAGRLSELLSEQNIHPEWNYTQRLNVLSECLFGRPYTEAKATLLDNNSEMSDDVASVYLVTVGTNTLLVVNGEYKSATNPGTDMEVSYFDIGNIASFIASDLGVKVKEYDMPEVLAEFPVEHDGAYVDMMREMGFFRPEGSLFYAFDSAQLITINGLTVENASFMEIDNFNGTFDKDALAWDPVSSMDEDMNIFEYTFTLGELCQSKRVKNGWVVHSKDQNENVFIQTFKAV